MSNTSCPPDLAGRAEFYASREAWLSARRSGIGGSEVAAALGLSPFKSPYALWAEKTGESEDTFDGNLNTRCGTLLEPVVRTLWQEDRPEARVFFHPFWIVRHKEFPFLYASLDWVFEEDGRLGVGEAKAPVASRQVEKWDDGVPIEHQLQGQHGLLCSGREFTSFARLMPRTHGWDFSYVDIERHDGAQEMLVEKLTEFWRMVETRTPPPVDAHETTRRALRSMRRMGADEADPKAWTVLADGAAQLYAKLEEAKAAKDEADGRVKLCENMLIAMMRGHRYGVIPGYGRIAHSKTTVPERTQTVRAFDRWSLSFSAKVKELPDFGT